MTRGIIEQARLDSADMYSLVCRDLDGGLYDVGHIQHELEEWRAYWDNLSGEKLDTELAKAARAEEIEGIKKMKVYEKVPISMCLRETRKRPIGTH